MESKWWKTVDIKLNTTKFIMNFFDSRPKKGSLTEYRGMKANIQVYQEMIDLCYVIHSEGRPVSGEPDLREIAFGELFQVIYTIFYMKFFCYSQIV